jgi:hypothetical protein
MMDDSDDKVEVEVKFNYTVQFSDFKEAATQQIIKSTLLISVLQRSEGWQTLHHGPRQRYITKARSPGRIKEGLYYNY